MATKSKIPPKPHLPQYKSVCSQASYHFQHRHFQIFDFYFFGILLATGADHRRQVAAEALAINGNNDDILRLENVKSNPRPSFDKLSSFGSYQAEIMITRTVDNFLSYLSDILQSCFKRQPDLLKSNESVRVEDVLNFSKKKDIVNFLIDKKVNELSYGGISSMNKFVEDRISISISDDRDLFENMEYYIELRNIYTHNRGIVNGTFQRKLKRKKFHISTDINKRLNIEYDDVVLLANNVFDIVRNFDIRVVSKFGIQAKRFETWERRFD